MSEIFPESPLTSLPAAVAFMGALPVPVGPQSQELSPERELEIRSLDLLALMDDRVALVISGHLAALLAEIDRLRAERHSTNEFLDDAVQELRARQSCPCPPPLDPALHQVGCPQVVLPLPGLREVLDGEHFATVHHDYRVGHDLPETGGAS